MSLVLPFGRKGASRLATTVMMTAALALAACSGEGAGPDSPQLPGDPPTSGALKNAAFVFDVNTRSGKVKVSDPANSSLSASIGGFGGAAALTPEIGGPSYSLIGNDVISISTSNYFASLPGAYAPNKIRVWFDVRITNKLTNVELTTLQPNDLPAPPAGQAGALLIPFSTNVTTTSGGTSTEDDNVVVVELPSRGEVVPSIDWNGSASVDQPVSPALPGAGGDPYNFFNDASCSAVPAAGTTSDCYRYETFGTVPAGGISIVRRVGFDIDASVGEFRARLIVGARLNQTSGAAVGIVSGTIASPERGALQGVTVSVQGGFTGTTDASGNYSITGVGVGADRQVTLSTLPSGCAAYTPNPGLATVTNGGTTDLDFSVTCAAFSGTVSGTITRTGAGTQDLAGTTVTIDPAPAGGTTIAGVVSGSGASLTYTAASVPVGTGSVALGNLPSGCTAPAAGSYNGAADGFTQAVNFSVNCDAPAAQYRYRYVWGTPTGGQVTLQVYFDPSGYNDPAINAAGADEFAGVGATVTLTGTAVSRLQFVSGIGTATFSTFQVNATGFPPAFAFVSATTTAGLTTEQLLGTFTFNVIAGAAGSVTTSSELTEVTTSTADVLDTGNGHTNIIEGTLTLP